MKKKIIILILIFSSFSFVKGQIIKSIGIKSGISLSNQSWDYSPYYQILSIKSSVGLYEVLTADFIIKKHWDLSADFGIYKSRGKSLNDEMHTHEVNYFTNKLSFLTFSPNIKLKTDFYHFTPYITIGPRIDYFIKELSEVNVSDKTVLKPLQFGFNTGIGINYLINKIALIAEYQYLYNFTNIIDQAALIPVTEDNITQDVVKINNHIISLGVKYYFKK